MENTKQDLFKESLSARINRLEQTVQELKQINSKRTENIISLQKANSMLMRGQEIDNKRYKEATSIRDKKIEKQDKTIVSLIDQVEHWKELYLFATDKHIKRIRNDKKI